VGEQDTSGCD